MRNAFLILNNCLHADRLLVTFLSILANNAIALPLAATFPTPELRYILNHSQASVFLTSEKHHDKAQEVISAEIESMPVFVKTDKILQGSKSVETVSIEDADTSHGGMMLYTSGTTSRPVIMPASHTTSTSLIPPRKASSSPPQPWPPKHNPSRTLGSTVQPTTSYTSSRSTTSTAA